MMAARAFARVARAGSPGTLPRTLNGSLPVAHTAAPCCLSHSFPRLRTVNTSTARLQLARAASRSFSSSSSTRSLSETPSSSSSSSSSASKAAVAAAGSAVLLAGSVMASQGAGTPPSLPVVPTRATISRLMLPDDANPAGNVHGGTILRLVDEVGWVAATKYVNQASHMPPAAASLARIEKMDFLKPMRIGEVSVLEAEVTYVSEHSIEVKVDVYAENVLSGTKRMTNQARTWYIAKPMPADYFSGRVSHKEARDHHLNKPVSAVPPFQYPTEAAKAEGDARYAKQKAERSEKESIPVREIKDGKATLIHILLPSDCYLDGVAQAGAVLKLMDNAAGVASVRHCHSNVVTASLEAVDFLHPVFNGDLLEVHARPIFTSDRSMDVEVNVYSQNMRQHERVLATTSVFTFVSLDEFGRPQKIPAIAPTTDEEKLRYELGKRRYMERKEERQRMKAAKTPVQPSEHQNKT